MSPPVPPASAQEGALDAADATAAPTTARVRDSLAAVVASAVLRPGTEDGPVSEASSSKAGCEFCSSGRPCRVSVGPPPGAEAVGRCDVARQAARSGALRLLRQPSTRLMRGSSCLHGVKRPWCGALRGQPRGTTRSRRAASVSARVPGGRWPHHAHSPGKQHPASREVDPGGSQARQGWPQARRPAPLLP